MPSINHSKKLLLTLVILGAFVSAFYMTPIVRSQTYGAHLSKVVFKTIKTPDAQVGAMILGQIDMYPGLIRPGDAIELGLSGKKLVSTKGGHFCYFTFNLRSTDDDTDGIPEAGYDPHDESKRLLLDVNFRQAVAHLTPKVQLIGSIFKFIVERVDTVIPEQMGKWHNPNIPKYEYAPGKLFPIAQRSAVGSATAVGQLLESFYFQDTDPTGVVDSSDFWSYDAAGNEPLGDIDFLSPSYQEAPTSYEIVATTVDEMKAVGLNNIHHQGMTFTDMLDFYVYPQTFDMYFLCWSGLSADPDNLWAFFNSFNDQDHGRNHPGINETIIEELTTIVHESLNETAVLNAAWECQALLMSGEESYGLSYVPIYSRNYFDAYHEDLEGIVNMPLTGSDNGWTFFNMRWEDGVGHWGDNSIVYVLGTDVKTLNPLVANSADEVEVWSMQFDGLDDTNPYTLDDIRGMADYRGIQEFSGTAPGGLGYVEGMMFNYTIKSGITWHDGTAFTTDDIKFAFDYMNTYKPALWPDAYDKYVGVYAPTSTYCEIYYNKTSLWLKDSLSGIAVLLPKHIWQGITNWDTYQPWADTSGMPAIPGAGGALQTHLQGTGPWIFGKIDTELPGAIVWRNPNYYETQEQTEDDLKEMFYWNGDVSAKHTTPDSRVVDIQDLVLIALAWGSDDTIYPERYNEICDLIDDQKIRATDLNVSGRSYGQKKWYPFD